MADGAVIILVLLAIVALGVGAFLLSRARKRRIEVSLQTLLARDPRWQRDTSLCGRDAKQLASRCPVTPRGDRRYGLEHVITGPLDITALGAPRTCWASCGIWWYEDEQTSTDSNGNTSTTYSRRDLPVVAVALPVAVPTEISIGAESVFGRIGLTRGGQQVESDAFNRRFRVRGGDPSLTVQLLDAHLQHHLLEHYTKRSLWVSSDLAVLGGDPLRPDPNLYGPIRNLPGLQADATDLLGHVPAQFWRSVGLPSPGSSVPPPTQHAGPLRGTPPPGSPSPRAPAPPAPAPPAGPAARTPPAPPTAPGTSSPPPTASRPHPGPPPSPTSGPHPGPPPPTR